MAKKNKNRDSKKTKKDNRLKSLGMTIILAIIVIAVFSYLIINENDLSDKDNVLVIVNGEKITQSELSEEYESLPDEYKQIITKEELLDQLIDQTLILQQAKDQGIVATESEIDAQLQSIISQFPDEQQFNDAIEEQGMTIEELREEIEDQIIFNKLIEKEVLSEIEVSNQDIINYYNENIDQFVAQKGMIRVAHILVETEELALDLRQQLQEGADFEELALENSIDSTVSINQGDLGFFSKGDMVKEFEDVAFSLRVGEISMPVETKFGFHIIKRLPDRIALADVKEDIVAYIKRSMQSEAIDAYLEGIRAASDIQIVSDEKTGKSDEKDSSLEVDDQPDNMDSIGTDPLGDTQSDTQEDAIKALSPDNEFIETGDDLCTEKGNPIIRFYTSSDCEKCKFIEPILEEIQEEYDVVVYGWELDTSDNIYTQEKESTLPRSEFEILKKYNPKGAVPSYVFGCTYKRIGNAYKSEEAQKEKAVFDQIMAKLNG